MPTAVDLENAKLWLQEDVPGAFRDLIKFDLRWSYVAVGALVLVGGLVNLIFASHSGWTVWPIVGAIAIMLYVHEASERNGQGIPPLHVYAFFFGAMILFGVLLAFLKLFNPFILLGGVAYVAYHCVKEHLKQREAVRLVEGRKKAGLCIHCGEPADPRYGVCPNCGEEPDPEGMLVDRVASIVRSRKGANRTRAVLTREKTTAGAARKEAALVQKRQSATTRKR